MKMGMSDKIEAFIMELLKNDADFAEFGRNELADIFGCVPSQINYVISTRFNPERGYVVESRRGGGGYIKIQRVASNSASDIISRIGKACDFETAKIIINYLYKQNEICEQAARMLLGAVSDNVITVANPNRDILRANILKNALSKM